MVNTERYITPDLKEVEEKSLSSEERSKKLEYELFEELRLYVAEYAEDVQQVAQALAELDCLQSFAEVAYRSNYCKPASDDHQGLDTTTVAHPLHEKSPPT